MPRATDPWRHVPAICGASAFLVGLVIAAALKCESAPAQDPGVASLELPQVRSGSDLGPTADAWWCLCYRRVGFDEPVTACRPSLDACKSLRRRVNTAAAYVAGSGTLCQPTPGPYPWQALGHQAQWGGSDSAVGWTSPGACLISSAGHTAY